MDLAQTQAAVAAVQKAGVKLQIGFNRRFDHNFKRVRDHVQEGRSAIRILSKSLHGTQAAAGVYPGIWRDFHGYDDSRF